MATVKLSEELSIADVLDGAADLIEPEGAWTQGAYGTNSDGSEVVQYGAIPDWATCFCVLGAVRAVGGYRNDDTPPVKFLRKTLGGGFVHDWNDAPERTQQEVVAKLREAAALAREQGK